VKYDLVSIIMPAYKSDIDIYDAINSVINQTYTNWELLIINDGLTNDEVDVILEFKDSRIKLYETPNIKSGPSVARNIGIDLSLGKYLAFIDSDDIWLNDKLLIQINHIHKNNIKFCYSSFYRCSKNLKYIYSTTKLPKIFSLSALLKNCFIGCSTVVIDKLFLNELRFNVDNDFPKGREDYFLWLRLSELYQNDTSVFSGINEPLVYYRVHNSSLTGNKFIAAKNQFIVYKNYMKLHFLKSFYYFSCYSYIALKIRILECWNLKLFKESSR